MHLSTHITLSLVLSALFYPVFGIATVLIFAGGVVADLDHYIAYVYRFRKLSPLKCHKFYNTNYSYKMNFLFVFHLVELNLAVFLIGLVYMPVLIMLIGILFHLALDLVNMKHHGVEWRGKFSLIYRKRRKLRAFN